MRLFMLCLCAIVIYAWTPAAEARGRTAGNCQSCANGVCELPQAAPEQAKAWPWTKPNQPPMPVVAPTVAPAVEIVVPPPPAPVVEPAAPAIAITTTATATAIDASHAEARKPLRRILASVAACVGKAFKGIGRLGQAIRERERKPIAAAVKRVFGRRR